MIASSWIKHAACLGLVTAMGNAQAGLIDLSELDPGPTQRCVDLNDGARACNTNQSGGSVGSGTFPSFLGSSGGQEPIYQHYNTTTDPILADNDVGNSPGDNAQVLLSSLGNDGGYAVFRLDIGEPQNGDNPLLTVDEISLYLGDGSLAGYDSGTGKLGGATPLWSLTDGDFIKLDSGLTSGSGSNTDMYLLIPIVKFVGAGSATNLQLFSRYGGPDGQGGWPNDGTFEEWSRLTCDTTEPCIPDLDVPAPAPLALLGLGLLGAALFRRRPQLV